MKTRASVSSLDTTLELNNFSTDHKESWQQISKLGKEIFQRLKKEIFESAFLDGVVALFRFLWGRFSRKKQEQGLFKVAKSKQIIYFNI